MALIRLQQEIDRILEQEFHSDALLNRIIQKSEIDKAIERYEIESCSL